MSKFVIKTVDAIKGKQDFKQLIILSDNIDTKKVNVEKIDGQLDIYKKSLEDSYSSSYNRILSIMDAVANNQGVSNTQWKDVTPNKEIVKEYEVKAGDLRVFLIKIPNGKLIILGGYKNQQKSDFKKFRSLKQQYLQSEKL